MNDNVCTRPNKRNENEKKEKKKRARTEKNEWKVNYCHFSLRPHFAPRVGVRSSYLHAKTDSEKSTGNTSVQASWCTRKREKSEMKSSSAWHSTHTHTAHTTDPPPFFHSFSHCVWRVMDFICTHNNNGIDDRIESSNTNTFFLQLNSVFFFFFIRCSFFLLLISRFV